METNVYGALKSAERRELDRLTSYLRGLEPDGWTEQSYCTDWHVYQVVSHIGSGSRIGRLRLDAWVRQGPPVSREAMQAVWGHFDSLQPPQMLAAYEEAVADYLRAEDETPDGEGTREVEGFAGKRPLYAYQIGRLWELALHSWDVFVTRDRAARLPGEIASLLASQLEWVYPTIDRQRAPDTRVGVRFTDAAMQYVLDTSAERPRLQAASTEDAPLVVEGPADEVVRLMGGRHFVPGTHPQLRAARGAQDDLNALRRAFRP